MMLLSTSLASSVDNNGLPHYALTRSAMLPNQYNHQQQHASAFTPVLQQQQQQQQLLLSPLGMTQQQLLSLPLLPPMTTTDLSPNSNAETSATSPAASERSDPMTLDHPLLTSADDPFSVEKYLKSPGGQSTGDAEINADDVVKVLCQVCGDRASGFHYGVHACEGCKGFFRRSIQQKLTYRACSKNQQCSVLRINRNRCQYCRLKKCIAVGMSRDAVRFGRVPKSEKERMRREMALAASRSRTESFNAQLCDEHKLASAIVLSHVHTCDFTIDKISPFMAHFRALGFTTDANGSDGSARSACPLNPLASSTSSMSSSSTGASSRTSPQPDEQSSGAGPERYSPAIRSVVDFAKCIPAFTLLSQADQVTLLKAGMFEVLVLRLSCLFDSASHSMLQLDGSVYRRSQQQQQSSSPSLVDSLFEFMAQFNALGLHDADIALYAAYVLCSPDRPGLDNLSGVELMHERIGQCLRRALLAAHPHRPDLLPTLVGLSQQLRRLSRLHQDKLVSCRMPGGNATTTATATAGQQAPTGAQSGGYCGMDWQTTTAVEGKAQTPKQQPHRNTLPTSCAMSTSAVRAGHTMALSCASSMTAPRTNCVTLSTDTSSNSDTDSENSASMQSEITQKHQMLALLLNRPSQPLQLQPALTATTAAAAAAGLVSRPVAHRANRPSNNHNQQQQQQQQQQQDQPLNLCVRT